MSAPDPKPAPSSTSDGLPHKPTKESARDSSSRDEARGQRSEPDGRQLDRAGPARREVSSESAVAKHPPHVTENDEDAPVQDSTTAPDEVPVLPANASGTDSVDVDEQNQPIDDESMYDRRPEEEKG
ncbi:MAG: hypothetical protein WD766_14635, partial [Gemmatimonadota bacterium]